MSTAIFSPNKKLVFFLACLSIAAMTLLAGALPAYAQTNPVVVDIVSITSSHNPGAGTDEDIEKTQKVDIVVQLDQNVNASAANKAQFLVNIMGAPGGGWIDGSTNPAMDFSVEGMGTPSNTDQLKITIFATNAAEIPNGDPMTATNDFFAMRSGVMNITAANGSTIPSITGVVGGLPLSWTSSTFANVVTDSGTTLSTGSVIPGNPSASLPPILTVDVDTVSQVRGQVRLRLVNSEDGLVTFSGFQGTAGYPAHNFIGLTTSQAAAGIAATLDAHADYAAVASGSTVIIIKTNPSYETGEELSLEVLTYLNQ